MAIRPGTPVVTKKVYGTKLAGVEAIISDLLIPLAVITPEIARESAFEAVYEMNRKMIDVFNMDGPGWAPNTDTTVELKDGTKVMLGRTQTMAFIVGAGSDGAPGGEKHLRMVRNPSVLVAKGKNDLEVEYGWPDDIHPDSDGSVKFVDGQLAVKEPGMSKRPISVADIALFHELGYVAKFPVPSIGGKAKFRTVPVGPRPWLTKAAAIGEKDVLITAERTADKSIGRFLMIGAGSGIPRTFLGADIKDLS